MKTMMQNWGILLGLALGSAAPLGVGCGSDEDPGPCVEGEACICEENCAEACDGPGCGFTCQAGVTCDFDCPDGSCAVNCGPGSDCSLACPTGGCTMNCTADAACEIETCDGGNCILECGGSPDCTNACGPESGCVTS